VTGNGSGPTRREVLKGAAVLAGAVLLPGRAPAQERVPIVLVATQGPVASAELWRRSGIEEIDTAGAVVLVADGTDAFVLQRPTVLVSKTRLLSLQDSAIVEAASSGRTTVFDFNDWDPSVSAGDDEVVARLERLRSLLPPNTHIVAAVREDGPRPAEIL